MNRIQKISSVLALLVAPLTLSPDYSYAEIVPVRTLARADVLCALALGPKLIVGDEPVSALDVSIQAQVINLLQDLQHERKLSYLFISHNLAVVEHISHRIAVMYLGRIVELTTKRELFVNPLHPYTEALLAAATAPDPKRRRRKKAIVQGDVPSPAKPPPGCHFHTRCPYAVAECRMTAPPLIEAKSWS